MNPNILRGKAVEVTLHMHGPYPTALQSKATVTSHLKSKQFLPFGFALVVADGLWQRPGCVNQGAICRATLLQRSIHLNV